MIARIVLDGPPLHNFLSGKQVFDASEHVLIRSFENWPQEVASQFVITPGGFLNVTVPAELFGSAGWSSTASDIRRVEQLATEALRMVVTPRVARLAEGRAKAMTIGVDVNAEGTWRHAELVAFVRVKDGAILRWTGKSYPTSHQEKTLLQQVDLDSHCLRFGRDRVLILGCHDLNMFSPRGYANQNPNGKRRARCERMLRVVDQFRPTAILHHPHFTDSDRIWRLPWLALTKRSESSLDDWASGICFYRRGGSRRNLAKVLAATRAPGERGLEFVFQTKAHRLSGPRVIQLHE